MNNNEETNSNKDQEQKIDTPENNGVEPNLEINLEKDNDIELTSKKGKTSKSCGSDSCGC